MTIIITAKCERYNFYSLFCTRLVMKKAVLERSFVVVLFLLVMVVFSLAERDTQKLFQQRNEKSTVVEINPKPSVTAKTAIKSETSATQ